MSASERTGTSRQRVYGTQTRLFCRGNEDSPQPAYVTRAEMQEFKRDICDLLRLFLESYVTCAIGLDGPYIDIHLN